MKIAPLRNLVFLHSILTLLVIDVSAREEGHGAKVGMCFPLAEEQLATGKTGNCQLRPFSPLALEEEVEEEGG